MECRLNDMLVIQVQLTANMRVILWQPHY